MVAYQISRLALVEDKAGQTESREWYVSWYMLAHAPSNKYGVLSTEKSVKVNGIDEDQTAAYVLESRLVNSKNLFGKELKICLEGTKVVKITADGKPVYPCKTRHNA